MPNDVYNGADSLAYQSMSCHCFALSGTPAASAAINTRYSQIGDHLSGTVMLPAGNLADRLGALDFTPAGTMLFLREEFGFARGVGTDIFLWGFFRNDQQLLPEHMWFTMGGRIFDTMPNHPIRRDVNNAGRNPPSEAHLLPANRCFSAEVSTLYIDQLKFVTSGNWTPE